MPRLAVFLLLFISFGAQANPAEHLKEALKNFSVRDFVATLQSLEQIKQADQKTLASKYYLMALANNRLQQFDLSIPAFEKAIKFGSTAEDLNYEFGQALYASNELRRARDQFKISAKNNFLKDSSIYYMAHISQILEEGKESKKYFSAILKSKTAEKSLKQVARFQLAETFLRLAREDKDTRRLVRDYVLPQMRKAEKVIPDSPTAKDIAQRITEVEKEFGLDPNTMINGRKVSAQRWGIDFSQTVEYDNNVTLANDLPGSQASQKDSFLFETSLDFDYSFIFYQRYVIRPQLDLTLLNHEDRDSQTVYSNDSYNISPAIDFKFEYKIFDRPATNMFEYDYDYKARARDATRGKEKIFNSRTTTYSLGQKIRFLSDGDTTIKVKKKLFRSYDKTLHNDSNVFSIDQVVPYSTGHLSIFLFQFDDVDNFNQTSDSTTSMLLRTDYIIPSLFFEFGANLALSYTILKYDNAAKKAERGTETTFSPSAEINRHITKDFEYSLTYTFTKNTSRLSTSDYNKHVLSLEFSYSF